MMTEPTNPIGERKVTPKIVEKLTAEDPQLAAAAPPYDPDSELQYDVPPAPRFNVNPYIKLIKKVWDFAGGVRSRMVLFYFLYIPAIGFSLLQPYAFGQAVNAIQQAGPNMVDNLVYWLSVFIGAMFLFWAFHGPGRIIERSVSFRVYENFMGRMYCKLTELPLVWHQQHHSGEIINRINTAGGSLRSFAEDQFAYFQLILRVVGTIGAMTWIAPVVGLVATLVLAINFFILLQFDRRMARLVHEGNELNHRYNATFFDYVGNMTTLLILRLGALSRTSLGRRLHNIYPNFMSGVRLNEYKYFTFQNIMTVVQGLIILGYVLYYRDANGVVAIGTLVTLTGYIAGLGGIVDMMTGSYNNLVRISVNVAATDQINADHAELVRPAAELPPLDNWQSLTLHNVTYQHPRRVQDGEETQKPGVRDITVSFKKGEKVALIGYSGGGKSTLLGLLRGTYPAQAGSLSITTDEAEQAVPFDALAHLATLIPQDPEIFENTVRFNITLGLLAHEEDIFNAMRMAAFLPILEKMPAGLKTMVNEKGVNMSIGQKQRLALARGIFAATSSPIVLLDEPTSSLDLATEQKIFDAMFTDFADKTIIATLHRLHLLPRFDRIIFMDSGHITADGPAKDLLSQPGPVRDLYRNYQTTSDKAETPEDIRVI